MGIDPLIIQNVVENVRAEVLPAQPTLKLDPALIDKIATKVPLFRALPRQGLLGMLALAEHFPVQRGDVVFNEGDIGNSFYVLISGEVVVEKTVAGKKANLARLEPGECFGEMALVDREVRSATVRALGEIVVMRFYREQVDANPVVAAVLYRNIARILAGRLGASDTLLASLM